MPERTDPTNPVSNPYLCQYLAVYRYALPYVRGKVVLDAGCGEGYGANLLATQARQVTAVDCSRKAIRQAQHRYPSPNLAFEIGDLNHLERDGNRSFDVVCCFHVIEHLREPVPFLRNVARLLTPEGCLLLSTPNSRMSFVEWPYHEREYTAQELGELLGKAFPSVRLSALHASPAMLEYRKHQADAVQRVFRLDVLRCRKWLPRRVLQKGYDLGSYLLGAHLRSGHESLMSGITVEDFQVRGEHLEEGVDLMALCHKSRSADD